MKEDRATASQAAGDPASSRDAAADRGAPTLVVNALAFGGGFAVMALEMLGGRILAPWFGGSIHVWGSVIAVFMLSLAVGYLAGGAWSLRAPSLRRFGFIFLVGAGVLYPLLASAGPIMAWTFERVEDPRYGSLVASLALFVAPTVVLGAISPYAVRLLVPNRERSGRVAGGLYFVSTLGSAAGTLATSFYFVLWFDIQAIVAGLAGLLALLGVAAVVAELRRPRVGSA